MNRFTPNRLTVARQRRGFSKRELAERSGLTDRTVVGAEGGEHVPSDETVDALASALRFPRPFFFAPELPLFTSESASFRALTRLPASVRDAALAAGSIAFDIARYVNDRFTLPTADVPDLRGYTPEAAAEAIRMHWGIGQERPIKNVLHLLEAHGVYVFSLAEERDEVDAFSVWSGEGRPFVFLNTTKSAERSRFDAAHELAHLLLHRHGAPQGREAELEADRFASALLMPRAAVIATTPRFVTLEMLVDLKSRWCVSVAALARRLHDLQLISEWQYRSYCVAIAEKRWRKNEPKEAERETSQVWRKVLDALRAEGTSIGDIARELHLPVRELEALVFRLVLHTVDGGAAGAGGTNRQRGSKPALRLVR